MESELRKKFMMVTLALMTFVLLVVYFAMIFYNRYWYEQDTLQFLDWIAYSGVLQSEKEEQNVDIPTMSGADSEFSIIAIVTQNGKPVSENFVGTKNSDGIPPSVIAEILVGDEEEYKVGTYLYVLRPLSDNKILIVMTDVDYKITSPMRLLPKLLLILAGVVAVTAITFLLSRFVTKPAMKAMLREKQFVSDASHELKTPLGAISINAQALAGSWDKMFSGQNNAKSKDVPLIQSKQNYERHIQNIIIESQRMNRLVERLLLLSKMEEEKVRIQTDISLSSCVEEMALTYESVAYEKGIHYDYDIAQDIVINGNEDEIKQLIAILIDNAIKHTQENGSVRMKLQRQKGKPFLCVENTGDGISAEDLPHIFERFYKTDVSRKGSSFGLGLAIAKAIAQRHNAIISAESEPDKITKFEVEF